MDKNKSAVETYNKIAQKYTDTFYDDLSDSPYIDLFLAKLPKDEFILDVGSGPGQFSKYIHNKGFNVEGIDLSKKMINIASKKVPEVKFKEMDMRKLEYSNEYFGGLLAAYSIIHIPTNELEKVFKEFFRVLKEDGVGLIIVQEGDPDHVTEEPLDTNLEIFLNLFSPERIKKIIKNFDFEVVDQKIAEQETDEKIFSDKIIYTYFKKI